MDPYGGKRMYTVADSRLPMYCTYTTRPAESYFSLGPQTRIVQCTGDPFIANSRLMVVPPSRIRRGVYGYDPDEDEDEEAYLSAYRPSSSSARVESYLDDVLRSPEMEGIESETRRIRRDAQAVLQRLGEPSKKRAVKLSSVYFPDLDYTTTTTSSSSSSPAYNPRSYSTRRASPSRDARTPDLEDFYRSKRPSSNYTSHLLLNDPVTKVQSEINRKAIYSADCRKINDSVNKGGLRRPRREVPPVEAVKNNINIRAQYASLRAAAGVGLRKPNDYLML